VGVDCVVLAALGVDDVAALAIAAPPAAREPTTARVARAVAIRCDIFSPFLSSGTSESTPDVSEHCKTELGTRSEIARF
jgi:hypothetical protein